MPGRGKAPWAPTRTGAWASARALLCDAHLLLTLPNSLASQSPASSFKKCLFLLCLLTAVSEGERLCLELRARAAAGGASVVLNLGKL